MLPFIETLFIEVPHKSKTFLIGVIYRTPDTNVELFNDKINNLIEPIRNNYDIVLVGDFNICLLKDDHCTQPFWNCMQANSLFPTILEATRVANISRSGINHITRTLIDNIFIKQSNHWNWKFHWLGLWDSEEKLRRTKSSPESWVTLLWNYVTSI